MATAAEQQGKRLAALAAQMRRQGVPIKSDPVVTRREPDSPNVWTPLSPGSSGPSAAEQQAAAAAAAARAAARAQSQKENENTQAIINTLLGALKGYETGRDTLIKNAKGVYDQALTGMLSQYNQNIGDLDKSTERNEADESAKTYANRSNRARERMNILEQAAAQGAGETDQLRSIMTAFENADANQLEVTTSYQDTLQSIRSSLTGLNSSSENARRNAWGQYQDSQTQAWQTFADNTARTLTDIQRTAASNTNIDSDTSVGFTANFQGRDPAAEAAKWAGFTRAWEAPDEEKMTNWAGKRTNIGRETNPQTLAGMTRIGGIRKAEGADLRKWTA